MSSPERPAPRVEHVELERLAEARVRPGGHLPQAGDPGGNEKRSKWCSSKSSVSYGMHGRGPTSDMSPRRTLMSCGSSSRLVLRSQRADARDASVRSSL